jgi:hypothetical protein
VSANAADASSGMATEPPATITLRVCKCGEAWSGGNTKYCPSGCAYEFTEHIYARAERGRGSLDQRILAVHEEASALAQEAEGRQVAVVADELRDAMHGLVRAAAACDRRAN